MNDPGQSSPPGTGPSPQRLEGVNFLVGLISGIIGLIGTAWWLIALVTGLGDYELAIWLRERTPLFPTEATHGQALPFEYAGEPIRSAALVDVNVTNLGSHSLGTQDSLWHIQARPEEEGVRLLPVGQPRTDPPRTQGRIQASAEGRGAVVFLGLLEPGATVDFQLLALNAEEPRWVKIAFTTSLEGIPDPEVSPNSRQKRLYFRFAIPALLTALALCSFAAWAKLRERWPHLKRDPLVLPAPWRLAREVIKQGLFVLLGTLLLGVMLAYGLGWLAALTRL